MALETPQGRADQMARSIEMFGRIVPLDEMLARAARSRRSRRPSAAGAALLDGPHRHRLGRRAARRWPPDASSQTMVAEPWADWGLIDSGDGQKLGALRPGHRRPARAAGDVGAGARRLGAGRDLRSRLRRGRRRPLGPASRRAARVGAVARAGPLPRLADAVPPPRLLPRHGAAMGLDAGALGGRRCAQPVRLHRRRDACC